MLRVLLLSILSDNTRRFLRNWYAKYRKFKFRNVYLTENELRNIITENLGVKSASVVFVHSSINKINLQQADHPLVKGKRILSLLEEIVGKEGTLLFPCNHISGRAEDYLKRKEVFNVKKSPTTMGIIPELARIRKGAYRSLHPTNSICAIGNYAKELTSTHHESIYPCGEQSPYYRIVDYNGIIIGIGVGTERLSFVHCVEDILKDEFPVQTRIDKVFEGKVVDENGNVKVVNTLAAHKRIKWHNTPKYIQKYIPKDICRDININGMKFFVANARKLFDLMKIHAQNNITIYPKLIYRKIPAGQKLKKRTF